MPDLGMLQSFLARGQVDAAVFALRPDYRAMLVAVDGLVPGPSEQVGEALLQAAEAARCTGHADMRSRDDEHGDYSVLW